MMQLIRTIRELQEAIRQAQVDSVGFVPTMGALHMGHISLVNRCVRENDLCIVSVFVNPTQFNDARDLERYPRTPEADAALLEQAGCQLLFMPSVEEMYPEPDTRVFDLGAVAAVMEGAFRPGHFNGVAQVVSKLFYAVQPDTVYLGEKDFQQIAVIRAMTRQLQLPVRIVPCPIVREPSGLALSSRNALLSEEQRKKAARISQVLSKSVTFVDTQSVAEVKAWVAAQFQDDAEFRLDYYSIVDGDSLQDVTDWQQSKSIVGCIAIYLGNVRLIDNIKYKA